MFIYAKYGELIDFEHRSLKLVFGFIKSAVDRDRAAYEERCKRNTENAKKGSKKKEEKEVGANMSYDQLIGSLSSTE